LRRQEQSPTTTTTTTTWPTYSPSVFADDSIVVADGGMVGTGTVPCLTASECKSKYDALISSNVINGYFYTDTTNAAYVDQRVKGCVLKGDNVYFGGDGTMEQMGSILDGRKIRLWCDDVPPSNVIVDENGGFGEEEDAVAGMGTDMSSMPHPQLIPSEMCMSMMTVEDAVASMGTDMSSMPHPQLIPSEMCMSMMITMPTAPSMTYQMMSMTMDVTSMSMMSLPSLVTSQYVADATMSCEIGMNADVAKSCPDGEYCSLGMGACDTKMTVYDGVCVTIPTICTLDYDPVW
jgi:hypothetical protein